MHKSNQRFGSCYTPLSINAIIQQGTDDKSWCLAFSFLRKIIISFDPKDVPDHGLTVDLAQSLGEKFCKEHFPGHQAIVCTHPDGHNGSGNVHVHIVINSLRIMEVPFMPYMDRPCDTQPGMKHRCTNAAMEYLRSEVMEMCHDAGLYQIDLLNASRTRITEREYWAKKKGQLALDEENAVLAEQGLPTKQTKFETDKDKLREEIRMALSDAVSFEDFAEKLLRRGIIIKESRGRLSYLTSDRTKPITARKLGDDFDKAAVFAIFVRNAKRVRTKSDFVHSAPAMQKIINERDTVSRMVDVSVAKEKGKGYEHWAKKHNIKNASRAYLLYQEMGFESLEELAAACDAAHEKLSDIRTDMKSVEAAIAEKKELRNNVLNYLKTKYVLDGLKACKNEKARQKYRDEHDSDFIILNAAKRYFDSKGLKKLPTHKTLQTEIEQHIKEKNELYNQYQTAKEEAQRLDIICVWCSSALQTMKMLFVRCWVQKEVQRLRKNLQPRKERCKSPKTVWLNWTSYSSVFTRIWSTGNCPKLVFRCCLMIMSRSREN